MHILFMNYSKIINSDKEHDTTVSLQHFDCVLCTSMKLIYVIKMTFFLLLIVQNNNLFYNAVIIINAAVNVL